MIESAPNMFLIFKQLSKEKSIFFLFSFLLFFTSALACSATNEHSRRLMKNTRDYYTLVGQELQRARNPVYDPREEDAALRAGVDPLEYAASLEPQDINNRDVRLQIAQRAAQQTGFQPTQDELDFVVDPRSKFNIGAGIKSGGLEAVGKEKSADEKEPEYEDLYAVTGGQIPWKYQLGYFLGKNIFIWILILAAIVFTKVKYPSKTIFPIREIIIIIKNILDKLIELIKNKFKELIQSKYFILKAFLIILLVQLTFFIPLDTREYHLSNDCSGSKVFAGLGNIFDLMFAHCTFISWSRIFYMIILNLLVAATVFFFIKFRDKQ